MTINKKIQMIRKSKRISQAELAFKVGCTIQDINNYENNGAIINGFVLLKIINAFEITINEFKNTSF